MTVSIEVEDDAWTTEPGLEELTRSAVRAALAGAGRADLDCEVAVLFTDDAAIAEINAEWRGKDTPTNVLSFPTPDDIPVPRGEPRPLGDVVLAHGVIAREAVDKTLFMLDAAPVPSGTYRAVFAPEVMVSFLSTFSGVFSAENAQQGMSLLAGKEGQTVAAPCVTLTDDPLRAGGWASCPFDGEGVACFKKNVLENGVLKTLLHNLKTAKKAGVRTTGNASRAGYAAPVGVAPTNFYFAPGALSPDALCAQMGDGLVILDVSGLHAGANPISGDFSLIAKGYVVKDGKKASAVNQITVAGNFYQLLQNIRAFGDDLTFPNGGIGSPSADVGEISVAGK